MTHCPYKHQNKRQALLPLKPRGGHGHCRPSERYWRVGSSPAVSCTVSILPAVLGLLTAQSECWGRGREL